MQIFWYFQRSILIYWLVVVGFLFSITVVGRFVQYLDEVIAGLYSKDILIELILLRIPSFLDLIIPISCFFAVLIALARMRLNNELIIFSTSGMSRLKVYSYIFPFVLTMIVLFSINNFFLLPISQERVGTIKLKGKSNITFSKVTPGTVFQHKIYSHMHLAAYVQGIDSEDNEYTMEDLFFVLIQEEHIDLVVADSAREVQLDNYMQLVMEGGYYYQLNREGRILEKQEFGTNYWVIEQSNQGFVGDDQPLSFWQLDSLFQMDAEVYYWNIGLIILQLLTTFICIPLIEIYTRGERMLFRVIWGCIYFFTYLGVLGYSRQLIQEHQEGVFLIFTAVHSCFLCIALLISAYYYHLLDLIRLWNKK